MLGSYSWLWFVCVCVRACVPSFARLVLWLHVVTVAAAAAAVAAAAVVELLFG